MCCFCKYASICISLLWQWGFVLATRRDPLLTVRVFFYRTIWSTVQESNVTSSNMAAVSRDHETSAATSGDDQASASCSIFSANRNLVKVEIISAALSPLYLGRAHFIDFREARFPEIYGPMLKT